MAYAVPSVPADSDVRFDYGPEGGGGTLTVTVPAGPLSPGARRAAARGAMAYSATLCALGVAAPVVVIVALTGVGQFVADPPGAAALVVGVFGLGVFLLVWKVRDEHVVQVLTLARRQSADLRVDAERLLVETRGPLGDRSYDLPRSRVHRVAVVPEPRRDRVGGLPALPVVVVYLADGPAVRLLPGRGEAELRAIADALAHTLGIPQPERPSRLSRLWAALGAVTVNRTGRLNGDADTPRR